ncbi:hypothetical protein Clacol_003442 [Clathrus columnatus]|uniref:F-box domain-containing protein n=1 Tax=Clathrus columnatus TaxID=1419009 RepID=A0AAV5ABB7_9AGAM|nr:hypothetical protein Clacol_003442 [Clathrus columnatus]
MLNQKKSIKSKEKLENIHYKIREASQTIKDAFGIIRSEVQNISNIDANFSTQEERELLEQTIHVTTEYVFDVKTHLNRLALINKLPVELLTYIILLTAPPSIRQYWHDAHPYISLSGVCRHWRSVIIQNPDFWTLVQNAPVPLVREILRRSKSTELDIIIRDDPAEFASALVDLFSKESNRIRTLRLLWNDPPHEKIIQLVLSSKQYPSLRGLVIDRLQDPSDAIIPLFPVLLSSEHLETLQCSLETNFPLDQLLHIISRLKNLDIMILSSLTPATVESLLSKSTKLRSLRLTVWDAGLATSRTLLPELYFLSVSPSYLLHYFQTPKLSTVHMTWDSYSTAIARYPILEEFDLSSTRYLYIYHESGSNYILGSKDCQHCESSFSSQHEYFLDEELDIQPDLFEIDIISEKFPNDIFHFSVGSLDSFLRDLGLSLILPRLTNLRELYIFASPNCVSLQEIVAKIPSVEKLVIQHQNILLEFIEVLNDTSILPRLKHLSYKTPSIPEYLDGYLEVVGKSLAECVKLRRKSFPHALEFVALGGRCPYLPEIWLNELQKLGTKVVTSKGPEMENSSETRI